MLQTNETTHETTTTTTSPAHWWRRWMCPDCSGIWQEHPVELETDNGEDYTCLVCGCSTSYPEDDACPEIRDAWAEALDIFAENGIDVFISWAHDNGHADIELTGYTDGLNLPVEIPVETFYDREDIEDIWITFDRACTEFDPWREAFGWCESDGTPCWWKFQGSTSGEAIYNDYKRYATNLERVSHELWKLKEAHKHAAA